MAERFQQELAPLLLLDQEPQELCDKFTNIVGETAEEKLGRARKTKRPWITPEVLDRCDRRKEKKKKTKLGDQELAEWRIANRECRKELIEANNQWIKDQSEETEQNLSRHNSKKAFEIVKKLTGAQGDETKKKQASVIEDRNGTLLTKVEDVISRWKDYCEEPYNYPIQRDLQVLDEAAHVDDKREEEDILVFEVEWAMTELKGGKSLGADNIRAELIQGGGDSIVKVLHKLCNEILRTKKWPSQWIESVLITIPKKANTGKCSEHRTINLISHASR